MNFNDPWLRPGPVLEPLFTIGPRPPVKCPVCYGRGTMPHRFYHPDCGDGYRKRVKCRSCGGKGVL